MSLGYPESIVMVGGIFAAAKVAVTYWGPEASKHKMPDLPPNLVADISKLVDNQTQILVSLSKLDSQATHYKETLEELKADCKEDHMHIKLLHDWMVQFLAITKDDRLPPLEPRKR